MRVLFVSLMVLIVDQLSKLMVKGFSIPFLDVSFRGMFVGQKIPVFGSLFDITFVENPGIAFGIDFGSSFKLLISIFSLLASIGIFIYLYKNRNKLFSLRLSLALILGGAVGNLFDRIFYGVFYGYAPLFHGRVVDFLNLRFFNLFIFDRVFGNYVFNFADMAVTTGVILLLLSLGWQREADTKEQPELLETVLAENKE